MSKPRSDEVERVAREIIPYSAGCSWERATMEERIRAEDVAQAVHSMRWFTREIRRARGRTVGYVIFREVGDERGTDCWWEIEGGMHEQPINERMTRLMGKKVARVVIPRRRRKHVR